MKQIIKEFNLDSIDTSYQGKKQTLHIGDVYNRLTIKKFVKYKTDGNNTHKGCICTCICGNEVITNYRSLFIGDSMSCGCYQKELHSKQISKRNYKHGCSTRSNRERLYVLWGAMKDRVNNSNRKDSKWYSSKGLSICDEWNNSYLKFKEWSLKNGYKDGLSIDRIDNSKGYSPSNCRWIPLKEQNSNKTNNRYLTYNNETYTITEWSRIIGVSDSTINNRLKRGLTLGQALGFEDIKER